MDKAQLRGPAVVAEVDKPPLMEDRRWQAPVPVGKRQDTTAEGMLRQLHRKVELGPARHSQGNSAAAVGGLGEQRELAGGPWDRLLGKQLLFLQRSWW